MNCRERGSSQTGNFCNVTDAVALTLPEAFRRASLLHDEGRFEDAGVLLRDVILRDQGYGDLRNARGVMFAAMGRQLDALWCYRDAIARIPDSPGVWTNLGNTLIHLKYIQSAVACHRRALRLAERDDVLL